MNILRVSIVVWLLMPLGLLAKGVSSVDTTYSWKGKWIASEGKENVPYFAREFKLKGKVKKATLRASALGVFTMRLNGLPVTENRLEPGESQWDKTVLYATYDVTHLLRRGRNRLLAKVGGGLFHVTPAEGRYSKPEIKNDGTMAFLADLVIEYANGKVDTIATDGTWLTAPSPTLASNWWGGEDYDARQERVLDRPDDWQKAKIIQPTTNLPIEKGGQRPIGQLRPQEHEPVKVVETWQATSVTPLPNGDYVVDFGQNFAGVYEFTLPGTYGQTIRLQTSEQLNSDGTVNEQEYYGGRLVIFDTYTFAKDGMATWSPELLYHGFRYVQVSGLTQKPSPSDFKALRMRVACEAVGQFETSSPLINAIHRICRNSIESQLYHVFTDCPQREKIGWLDVPNQMYNSITCNFDFRRLCHKIVRDCFDAQAFYDGKLKGKVPSTVPHFFTDWDDDPNWGGSAILVPYRTWQTYGDRSLMERYYPQMKSLVDYYTSLSSDGMMPGASYSRLSDWGQESSGLQQKTAPEFTITCTYYYILMAMAEMANQTGHDDDAIVFRKQAEKTKETFNQRYYEMATASYAHGNQAELAMPLYYGLVDEGQEQRVADRLAEQVIADGYQVKTGECGLKPVLMSLAKYGYNDIVWRMACQTDYPSYGYFVENGCTTTPELWNMRYSQNHCMLDHIEEWFYTHLAGIQRMDVAYDSIVIRPYVPKDLDSLKASIETPHGTVGSAFYRQADGGIDFHFDVPRGSKATIILPDGSRHEVQEGQHHYQIDKKTI
ncbi:MAG: family 78 glycoside hydrolase catalytic domain [Prevotella sp.]|nr:family 78 glycoside hydrolase catalytic domain [Prevotella sp.]